MRGDVATLTRLRETGSRDERAANVTRLIWRQWGRSFLANTIAAAGVSTIVAMSPGVLAPGVAPGEWIRAMVVIGFGTYSVVMAATIVWGHVITRRTMAWFVEGRDPSPSEIDVVTAAPRTMALAGVSAWTVATLIQLTLLAQTVEGYTFPGWALPKTIAIFAFGASVGCTLTYMLNERTFRPYLSLILTTRGPGFAGMRDDVATLARLRDTGSCDERESHVGKLIRRQASRSFLANAMTIAGIGTIAAVSSQILAPGVEPAEWIRALAFVGGSAYFVLAAGAIAWGRFVTRRTMTWFVEGRDPSPSEIDSVAAAPRTTALARAIAWLTVAIILLIYWGFVLPGYTFQTWAVAKTVALGVFGAIVGCTLTYLLNERIFRPYLSLILPQDVAAWPRSLSLTTRLLLAWLTVAGVPLLLIAFTMVGLSSEQRDSSAPMLRATSVIAAGLGVIVFVVAGRGITVPLRRLQLAQDMIATGDLSPELDVADAAEVGHLEAGFNNMVDGLRGLVSEKEDLQAQLRAQLESVRASRARIVEAADAERVRIERNLHDGAQQRLLALSFALRAAERRVKDGDPSAEHDLRSAREELDAAMSELRELARGIHPAILDDEGLRAALESLAERTTVPTSVSAALNGRLPSAVETTAYFVVAESLTNVAKYAEATEARVEAALDGETLCIEVADDGKGGADPQGGSGLRGLKDRVAALGGTLSVVSPAGHGTRIVAVIPAARTLDELPGQP